MATVLLACCAFSFAQSRPAGVVSTGTWTPLVNQPTFGGAVVPLLMTDGSVMVQDCNNYDTGNMTNHWWKLSPDINGSYINGTWTQLADMDPTYGPLFYASAVLPDGRVFVMGGEYNEGVNNWTNQGAIYTPSTNTWTNVAAPAGWAHVGDAECCVLPNGKLMLADSYNFQGAILDPTTMTWTPMGVVGKETNFDEEGWNLLPDGTVLTVDVFTTPKAEKYIPWNDNWVSAGSTPVALTDSSLGYEMGPAILRFDGTVMQFGANPHTAIYTPPATPTDPGSWAAGPDVPGGNELADAAACLLPSGNILFASSPAPIFSGPANFFETNGSTFTAEPANDHSAGEPSFIVNFMVLPNGQVMETDSSSHVEIYTPVGGPADAWRPTITNAPGAVELGHDYSIQGTQFNGLSQTNAYGDDWTNATNYPIIRITNNATGHVFYCRTHDHSTMAVGTGSATVSTHFTVPAGTESGDSKIEVVANGIPSATQSIFVGNPAITTISPDTATAGDPAFTMTVNGDGYSSDSVVHWFDQTTTTDNPLTPDTVTGTKITVTVPATLVAAVHNVKIWVQNSATSFSNNAFFTINPANHPPVANAGTDQIKEATGPTTSFTLDGTASSDPDSDPLTYTWFDSSNVQVGTGSTLTLSRAVGVYMFKLTVSDGSLTDSDTVFVTVQDTTAPAFGTLPDITVAAASNAGTIVNFGPFTATDLVDGTVNATTNPLSGSTFPVGTTTVNVSATDAHTNTGHASFHVNVFYSWSGFLSPFPKQQFKMGSNIPIKFSLSGASAGITNLVAQGYWATVNGNIVGPDHSIGLFKYSNGSYQLNWKLNVPKGTYQIKAVFGDGSVHTIQVIVK